ncbi:YhgE/Pip domain-containing protein [Agilicoccus flavus]|uniref:YhgE/Pip domain-containing protein n=1 Tax=Agilicoccus flavus TaxID=2775968 RepID=UPI001CF71CBC|nr:YhgE/Pip domain-containing protein [Agilicoccus flavus]
MGLFPSLANSELSRLARGVFGKLVVLALVAVPSIYAGLLTYSNIDVTRHLDTVPAAVVNEDRPTTTTGADGKKQRVDLGRVVAGRLATDDSPSNLDWTPTDARGARAGLEDGTYYAVLTIPADFSASAVSTADADRARPAQLQLRTNDATSYLAGNIASSVANAVTSQTGDELTKTYLNRIYLGFNDIQAQLTKLASASDELADGVGSLATATTTLRGGSRDLASGVDRLAFGSAQLADGLDRLDAGAGRLATGVGTLADGNRRLADGLGSAAASVFELPAQTAALAKGARTLASGNAELARGATTLSSGLDEAAAATRALPGQATALADGAGELGSGVRRLTTGAGALATGAQGVAAGGTALADGAGRLADGARRVDTGAGAVAEGVDDLARRQTDVASGAAEYTRAVDGLAASCARSGAEAAFCARLSSAAENGGSLREGTAAAASGAADLRRGAAAVAAGTDELAAGAAPLRSGADELRAGATRLSTGADGFGDGVSALEGGADSLEQGLRRLAAAAPTLGQGVTRAAGAADALASGATRLSTGATTLSGGLTRLADAAPRITTGLSTAATSADRLADGAETLDASTGQLTAGISRSAQAGTRLSTGAASAASGAHRLDAGVAQLSAGVGKLDDGATRLAQGAAQGAKAVPTYDSDARSRLSGVVAEPVDADNTRLHRVPTYGTGIAPYFLALALWVGGMSMFFMLRPFARRVFATTAPTWRITLAGLATPVLLGVLQALALTAVVVFWVGIEIASPWRFLAFALLASVTFVAINHALNALLGPPGRFIGLLLVVVQLASAGATYPIESSPTVFQVLHPLLPMTYVVRAFRSLIAGGDLHLVSSAVVLLAWAAVSVLASALAAHRGRSWDVTKLRPATAL